MIRDDLPPLTFGAKQLAYRNTHLVDKDFRRPSRAPRQGRKLSNIKALGIIRNEQYREPLMLRCLVSTNEHRNDDIACRGATAPQFLSLNYVMISIPPCSGFRRSRVRARARLRNRYRKPQSTRHKRFKVARLLIFRSELYQVHRREGRDEDRSREIKAVFPQPFAHQCIVKNRTAMPTIFFRNKQAHVIGPRELRVTIIGILTILIAQSNIFARNLLIHHSINSLTPQRLLFI